MSLLNKFKNQAAGAIGQAAGNLMGSGKSVPVTFAALPQTLGEFTALPQAAMQTPFDTAALFVAAICLYPQNQPESIQMINFLKGPQPLSNYDLQFIAERMRGKGHLPLSYFNGSTPENNYTPQQPYTVTVSENPYSYDEQSYAKLFLRSGGADSPRPIKLRQAKDGKWYLWEQFLLADIRPPAASDPWA